MFRRVAFVSVQPRGNEYSPLSIANSIKNPMSFLVKFLTTATSFLAQTMNSLSLFSLSNLSLYILSVKDKRRIKVQYHQDNVYMYAQCIIMINLFLNKTEDVSQPIKEHDFQIVKKGLGAWNPCA